MYTNNPTLVRVARFLIFKSYIMGGFLVASLPSTSVSSLFDFPKLYSENITQRPKQPKNRLFRVPLSLQPLPSLRSVQWPPSAPLQSLPQLNPKFKLLFHLKKKQGCPCLFQVLLEKNLTIINPPF